jgi:hypothetical protein
MAGSVTAASAMAPTLVCLQRQLCRCVGASAAAGVSPWLQAGTLPKPSATTSGCRVLTSVCGILLYTQITEALAKIQAGEKFDAVSSYAKQHTTCCIQTSAELLLSSKRRNTRASWFTHSRPEALAAAAATTAVGSAAAQALSTMHPPCVSNTRKSAQHLQQAHTLTCPM